MIGLRIKLTLQGNVLDEIELRYTSPGTEVRKKREHGEDVSPELEFRNSTFFDTYHSIMASYDNHLMSNEKLELSSNSFSYDK